MNWEKELIELFNDPLLSDVYPLPPKITSDDRLVESFIQINQWVEVEKRMPTENNDNFNERILFRRLKNLRNDEEKKCYLKDFDIYSLLD
jgi:hypothetical protein